MPKPATRTQYYKDEIIRLLTEAGEKGINTKILTQKIPRWSARLHDLKNEGYRFHEKSERIMGNYKRIWLTFNPENNRVYNQQFSKPIKYEYDYKAGVCWPVYG